MHHKIKEILDKLDVSIHDNKDKPAHAAISPVYQQTISSLNESSLKTLRSREARPHYDHWLDKIYIPIGFPNRTHVAAHELSHWTGHASRLDRRNRYQEEACCAKHQSDLEELTVDLATIMLFEKLDIPHPDRSIEITTMLASLSHSDFDMGPTLILANREARIAVDYILDLASQAKQAA